jgi:hypothetical protein
MTNNHIKDSRLCLRRILYAGALCVVIVGAFLWGWMLGKSQRAPNKELSMTKNKLPESMLDIINMPTEKLARSIEEGTTIDLAKVEKSIHLTFPKGIKLLNAKSHAWDVIDIYAKFQMNESQMNQLMEMPFFCGKFSSTDTYGIRNSIAPPGTPWWTPNSVDTFGSAEVRVKVKANETEVTKIMISYDEMKDNKYVMYLYWTTER